MLKKQKSVSVVTTDQHQSERKSKLEQIVRTTLCISMRGMWSSEGRRSSHTPVAPVFCKNYINVFLKLHRYVFVQLDDNIYFSKFTNYLFKFKNVFVQIAKYICYLRRGREKKVKPHQRLLTTTTWFLGQLLWLYLAPYKIQNTQQNTTYKIQQLNSWSQDS